MGVVLVTEVAVRSSRWPDALGVGLELGKLHDRLGSSRSVALHSELDGERPPSVVVWSDFADGRAFGEFWSARTTDSEAFSLDRRLRADDGMVRVDSQWTAVDVTVSGGPRPKRRSNAATADYLVEICQVELADEAAAGPILEAAVSSGAHGTRLLRLVHAGAASGSYVLTWAFEDAAALGRALDSPLSSFGDPARTLRRGLLRPVVPAPVPAPPATAKAAKAAGKATPRTGKTVRRSSRRDS